MLGHLELFAKRTAAKIFRLVVEMQCRHTERTQVYLFSVTVVQIHIVSSNEALCEVCFFKKPAVTYNVYPIFAW